MAKKPSAVKTNKKIVVSLSKQLLQGFEGENLVHSYPCYTGSAEHWTPAGKYQIFDKQENGWSNTYQSPMPYAMYFSPDRKAIHSNGDARIGIDWAHHGMKTVDRHYKAQDLSALGSFISYWQVEIRSWRKSFGDQTVGSHGCVNVGLSTARILFAWAPLHTPVIIQE